MSPLQHAAATAKVALRGDRVCLSGLPFSCFNFLHLHRSRPWRRRETRQARQHPISPSKPTRGRGVTTRSPRPSATPPLRRAGSTLRRRFAKPAPTSAASSSRSARSRKQTNSDSDTSHSVAFERLHGQPRGWDVFASRAWEHAHTDDIVDDDGFL